MGERSTTSGAASRKGKQRLTAPDRADVQLVDHPIALMGSEELSAKLDQLTLVRHPASDGRRLDLTPASERGRVVTGMRYLLSADEGEGYWDLFKPKPGLVVIIADAIHRQDTWVPVDEAGCFKLRLLLEGRFMRPRGTMLLQGPQAQVQVLSQQGTAGYFVAGGARLRAVILECQGTLLTGSFGIAPEELPSPLRDLFDPQCAGLERRIPFGARLFGAAQDILESRYHLPPELRSHYLEAKSTEILCQTIGELSTQEAVRKLSIRLSTRDLNGIYEVRDYLGQHYVTPPSLAQLARMVGINQTKLKAGFKQAIGMTAYQFVIERRMERAAELLLTGTHNISEVAYMVGYEYPANFTYAFKRKFGHLPRVMKRQG